jgi:YgiT-type zinc finger domain-containing protein
VLARAEKKMAADQDSPLEFCEICHVGELHLHRATYARWHAGRFVVLPGVPAWRCDVCGDTFYDAAALEHLALLLGPEMDAEHPRRWRPHGIDENLDAGLGDRRRI